ncbi:prepilin peptidase [Arthrobacter sp. Br18]|uniref:prepilin peptidase n=1 Tax=Arthrobacter sp. Br18 TaxID=1312954 RepID=UPI0004AED8F1|nr:prepilin peptidase [Arthrobacter sp. Br18]
MLSVPVGALLGAVTLAAFLLGAGCGYALYSLAGRDERTILPESWRVPIAVLTAMLFALVAFIFGPSWDLALLLVLPLFGVLLGAIDLRTKLLPNRIMKPFLLATALAALLGALGGSGWGALAGAALGGGAMFLVYLVLALISPAGMGMGDVKLGGVLGIYGGYLGAATWMGALLGGFLLGGVIGLVLLLLRRADRNTHFPFGPGMIAAAIGSVLIFST